ncbi:MAG TPA: efflux RND transporter periplasmic adaptor subunit [Candidatus Binataceae bacterium]|jgi:membrane fusion protein (multidrug efflux system)|nr:efflux RND transporter periplasmic adaptor subunit [Candidatus Binataceae bacterium]
MKIRRLATLAVVVGAAAGLYFLGGKYLWPPPDTSKIETVGIIEAPEVNITSRIAGRIVQLDPLEGDRVEQGETVCRIEDVDIKNQLAQARGNLAKARAQLHLSELTMARDRELFRKGVISAKERDDAQAAVEQDRAAVVTARAAVAYYSDQLKDTIVKSPIMGVVVSKNLEVGEWVTPGVPILTVDDLSTIWARVDVQETDLGSIRLGQPATVRMPTHPPMVFSGQVMAIGQEGQFATQTDVRRGRQDIRTFYVKVRVWQDGGRLKPGMTAEVTFDRSHELSAGGNTGNRAD